MGISDTVYDRLITAYCREESIIVTKDGMQAVPELLLNRVRQQIERNTTIQLWEYTEGVFQLVEAIVVGLNRRQLVLKAARAAIAHRIISVRKLGPQEEGHEFTIPLPENGGQVKVTISPSFKEGNVDIDVRPDLEESGKEPRQVQLYEERVPRPAASRTGTIWTFPNRHPGVYHLLIRWGDKQYKIPLEILG